MVDLQGREFQYVEKLPLEQMQKCKEIYEALYEELLTK